MRIMIYNSFLQVIGGSRPHGATGAANPAGAAGAAAALRCLRGKPTSCESRVRVTGPSPATLTSIIAPNTPVCTRSSVPACSAFTAATSESNRTVATSPRAAPEKLGLFPFSRACSVNCETSKMPKSRCFADVFQFFSRSSLRKSFTLTILRAAHATSSIVSRGSIPTNATNPFRISPTTVLDTTTDAELHRCRTMRIACVCYSLHWNWQQPRWEYE